MIGSHELLVCCLKVKDFSFMQSMMDHIDIWHLIGLSRDYPKTQSKMEWMFQHCKHVEKKLTYSMFEYLKNHPCSKQTIPLFLKEMTSLEQEFKILSSILYMKMEEPNTYVSDVLHRFNERHSIQDLWIHHRFDLHRIRHSCIIHYLRPILRQLIRQTGSIHYHYYQYNYLLLSLQEYKIQHPTIQPLFRSCYFYFSIHICTFLIQRRRMKEILWILSHYPLPSTLFIRLIEQTCLLSTDRPFFQLLSMFPSITLNKIHSYSTIHDSICECLVGHLSSQHAFEHCWVEALESDQLNWLRHLYSHSPKWFLSCWKRNEKQGRSPLIHYDLFLFFMDIPSLTISLTPELFFHFMNEGSRIPRMQELEKRCPSFHLELTETLVDPLESWTLEECQYLLGQFPIKVKESALPLLFSSYVEKGMYYHFRWLYETYPTLQNHKQQSLYSLECIYSLIQSNQVDALQWILSLPMSDYQRFHIMDYGMIFACKRGLIQSMFYFHQLNPYRYICKNHEIFLSSNHRELELRQSYSLDINVFSLNPHSISAKSIPECGICYESNIHRSMWTNCHHTFCVDCLTIWFQNSKDMNCPMCRQMIFQCHPLEITMK